MLAVGRSLIWGIVILAMTAGSSAQATHKGPTPSIAGVGIVTGTVQRIQPAIEACGCSWAITVENGNVTAPLPFRVWRVPLKQYEGKRVQLQGAFEFCGQPGGKFLLVFVASHLKPL